MSEEINLGKDKIIFVTEEDYKKPSTIQLPEPEEPPGLILEDGSINWNCPCLGGMATGPCGVPFREAFTCFHNSTAEVKGSDCFEAFTAMQSCMAKYPALYGPNENDEEDSPKIPLEPLENSNSDSPTPEEIGEPVKSKN